MTVLFADVVHSMDIAATVGTERMREIMADLLDRCTSIMKRFDGSLSQFTGDGIMAVFGAPIALEDHAVRACLAALSIQEAAGAVAADVRARDGIDLWLRVGLNSGQVIAGEIGSGSFGYAAIGVQVGMAQRMESVAPPGGVMLSASTAQLVDGSAALGQEEFVRIKGSEEPARVRRLLGIVESRRGRHTESDLIGRERELSAVADLLEGAIDGGGVVVGIVGSPGIGKSRLVREIAAMADQHGAKVFSTFCESHAGKVPFRAVAQLLRAATDIGALDPPAARDRLRAQMRDADPEDLLLFDDLLGISDPETVLPQIDPDARRRRLSALVSAAMLAREAPAIFVLEDVHWIDEVSESMLADFIEVIPQTRSLVLITYRPEYRGALTPSTDARTIALVPLSHSDTAMLVARLVGGHPSVEALGRRVAQRAAGNPYFAEELVRDLAERGALHGEPGGYLSGPQTSEVTVPATLQATIAARIDRLGSPAKRTLSAAAVIGSRFRLDLLTLLGVEPAIDELVTAQLVERTGQSEYVFHHPLVHSVAYQTQLKSARSDLHRRLAAAIEARDPQSIDENASSIAEHVEAAGDLHAAYGWHMRAAMWATNRDISAAQLSWVRAESIADELPADDPARAAMRIAPRTMLCGTGWRVSADVAGDRFEQLRELCAAAGDKASLGIGTAGMVVGYAHQDRVREASVLASEAWTLAEAVEDATLTVGLSFPLIFGKIESAEWGDVLRWSQTVIDLADGDPARGNFLVGSPLALACASRGMARYSLGHPGWHDDLRRGLPLAFGSDPASYAGVVGYIYLLGIPFGVLSPDEHALGEIEDALRIAERSSDDVVVGFIRAAFAIALMHRPAAAERDRGRTLGDEVRDVMVKQRRNLCDVPIIEMYVARERARGGDRDGAIPVMRGICDRLFGDGELLLWGIPATGVLVETLIDCCEAGDLTEADGAIERMAHARADDGLVMREIWLLRLRTLLARARGDANAHRRYRDRYRDMAKELDFKGHTAWTSLL